MYSLAIYNLKGGVGKTTTAVNLAYESAKQGYKTVLWDLDPQGASTWYFSETPKAAKTRKLIEGRKPVGRFIRQTRFNNLSLVPASTSQRHADILLKEKQEANVKTIASSLSETYEVLIIDCPPSFSVLAEQVIDTCELILCPTIPTPLSSNTIDAMQKLFAKNKMDAEKLHIVFSMVDLRRRVQKELLLNPPKGFPNISKHYIPYNTALEKMAVFRAPMKAIYPHNAIGNFYSYLFVEALQKIRTLRPNLKNLPAARTVAGRAYS